MNKVSRGIKPLSSPPTPLETVPNTWTRDDEVNGDMTHPAKGQGEHSCGARLEVRAHFSAMGTSQLGSPLGTGTAGDMASRGGGGQSNTGSTWLTQQSRIQVAFRGWRGQESRGAAEDRESCSATQEEPTPPWILPHHLCCLGSGIFHSLCEENGQR